MPKESETGVREQGFSKAVYPGPVFLKWGRISQEGHMKMGALWNEAKGVNQSGQQDHRSGAMVGDRPSRVLITNVQDGRHPCIIEYMGSNPY